MSGSGIIVWLILVCSAAWPLLDLYHELLAAASLGVASTIGPGCTVCLELLGMEFVHRGEAPVVSRRVDLQLLFAVALEFLG